MAAKRNELGRFIKTKEDRYCQDCGTVLCRYGKSIRCKACTNTYYNALGLRGMKWKKQSEKQKKIMKEKMSQEINDAPLKVGRDGYMCRYSKGKTFYEHRLIYCAANGLDEIPNGYDIHHINGNIQDNRIENLMMLSKSDHTKIHYLMRRGE